MTTPLHTRPFTPAREDRAALERRTVGRDTLLERLETVVRTAASTANRSHTLLVGPRGAGKSHAVEVLLGRVERDPDLAARVVVAAVPEDALGVTRVEDLLDVALLALGADRPGWGEPLAERQRRVEELLGDRLLLLVVENLDRVMAAFSLTGQRALRGWVEGSGQVLLLGTTPLLTSWVQDREHPFFGAFDTRFLDPLDATQGRVLLRHLAAEAGDDALHAFLATDTAGHRLEALAALTGGSPRLWTVLADCITPAKLDALVPLVRDLHERLTPYFQQLLWDLPPQAQRVVRVLAEGPVATMTVAEIDERAEIGAGISTVLKRLAADRWLEQVDPPGGDRRRSWYRLREPMVRHHVQYRSGDSRPLTLVTLLLRLAFDPDALEAYLLAVPLDGETFAHLAAALTAEPRRSNRAWADRDPDRLRAEARLWTTETGPWSRAEAGRLLLSALDEVGADPDAIPRAVASARERAQGRSAHVLALVAAGWDRSVDPKASAARLTDVLDELDELDPLRLSVCSAVAQLGLVLAPEDADFLEPLVTLIEDQTYALGAAHPDTMLTQMIALVRRALGGDAEALVRLPQALVSVIEQSRPVVPPGIGKAANP